MTPKHWQYNKDEDIVVSQLRGLLASNPYVNLIPSEKVIYNPHSDTSSKITLISGGGAGHEPLHGGFVGENLLDAAVSGAIFASPSTKQIMAAIKTKSDKERGTIIVVKNYTGDILHFGLVAERAKSEGYNVEMVVVSDDVAVGREQNKMVGRRGLAGTAIVHKVLGAASVDKKDVDLKGLSALGHAVNKNLATLAASLDRTSVPGVVDEEVEFTGPDEVELGLGIHNEPGTKIKPNPNLDELIKKMFNQLVSPDDKDRHYVDFDLENDDYVLLINNIGGTSSFELFAITQHVLANLPLKKHPKRVYVSDFVTSFNAPGFSITLLNLSNLEKEDIQFSADDILKYLDTPTNAPGWKPKVYDEKHWEKNKNREVESPMKNETVTTSDLKIDAGKFESQLVNALKVLLKEEPKITHYDTIAGDGDCGHTLANGSNSILKALKEDKEFKSNLSDPVATVARITELVEDSMGGTSGGLYSIYLTALVKHLKESKDVSVQSVGDAMYHALHDGLFKYTRARVGGRTLIDTLQPFVDTLHETGDLDKAVESATKGCEETKNLHASFGRASYVNEDEFKAEGGIPDPGAVGLLALIKGFTEKV
ncbi:DAK Dihydroxyacetone kinase [Candida maltosa Xu316]|uniref:Dihydroxyacetone kinase n=1 Tax=Candida maltosa (strain Xu316) TaxID=1245528 RepID=M3JC37_CANMX|nr:Dihydroxyacetone kinase [Candida maltosa Xu316]